MENLTFNRNLSVAEFKAEFNCSAINVRLNDVTGKHFFTAGSIKGAVSANYKEAPQLCHVTGKEGDFWMLCKENTSNVVDTL